MVTLPKVLLMLVAAYPKQEISRDTIDVYRQLLADVDPELLQTAALRHMTDNKWFPTIAELRQAAGDVALEKEGVLPAPAAFEMALHAPKQTDELTRRAVRMACGDFYNLRNSEALAADRARFMEAYNELTKTKRRAVTDLPDVKRAIADGRTSIERLASGSNGHE